jgi:hypothetical protein
VFARAGFAFRFHDGSFVGQGPVSGHTDERTFMAFRLATTGS